MKDMVKRTGREKEFEIASAATSTEALGCGVYSPVKKLLSKHGLSCEGKLARQMSIDDYGYYDYIVAMDERNIRNLARFVGNDPDAKVSLLMDYTDTPRDVADPWYTDDFEQTWQDVTRGCEGLLKTLL